MAAVVLFAGLFMKFARQAGETSDDDQCGHIAQCVGAALITIPVLVMTLVMCWHLFAKSLQLPGY